MTQKVIMLKQKERQNIRQVHRKYKYKSEKKSYNLAALLRKKEKTIKRPKVKDIVYL